MTTENILHIRILSSSAAVASLKRQFAVLDTAAAALESQPPVLLLPSVDAYYSLLTVKRIDLLCALRRHGPMSIRALAQHLKRDYKNVHGDTIALIESGLVERDANNAISTPWDRFEVSLPLQDSPLDAAA